jgi:hypothetical protein
LIVSAFNPQALTLSVNVSACIPADTVGRLATNGKAHAQIAYADQGVGVVKGDYVNAPFDVLFLPFNSASGESENNVDLKTTLGRLVEGSPQQQALGNGPQFASLGQLTLPLSSTQPSYPFDWYATSADIYPGFGGVVTYRSNLGYTPVPQFQFVVAQDPDVGPFHLAAGVDAGFLTLRLSRDTTTRWYVLVVALIPLVLAALLVVVLFSRRPSTRDQLGPEAIIGVAAALLAVLPIRLVLVPADLPGLTLLDYWLGFVMAMLAAVACVGVWRSFCPAAKAPTPDGLRTPAP